MLTFFSGLANTVYAVQTIHPLSADDLTKLQWLLGNASLIEEDKISGPFKGPRKEMITPWSTNAVEIAQNMGVPHIERFESFKPVETGYQVDPMLELLYPFLDQSVFTVDRQPEPVKFIEQIDRYNRQEGLALNDEEVAYLQQVSKALGRPLTDSEVFGFSQVNSEHCRHKIFNGKFIIDGKAMEQSLFQLIKRTSQENPNKLISAYKDNVAFVRGPQIQQFAPKSQDKPDFFRITDIESVISLKAETHNFPTTVEPFNGASTGTGGEIRDRMAGGKASIPLAGTAVYMTPYSRMGSEKPWETGIKPRKWLYQTPLDLLIKASNGASDFGNKFGQPLICGSVLTFEYQEQDTICSYDKVIMLAGGIGFGRLESSIKDLPQKGDCVVVLGGDNYRIGMGGGAVSSVATGHYGESIELNAVQRANPEMQKRVANAIRALAEQEHNPIISIHDHGAGGHLNCLSELVEESGATINIDSLPVGDPTLSAKEIISNESQERMGLVMSDKDLPLLKRLAERERAPMYVVGEVTGDRHFRFESKTPPHPMDWQLEHLFGNSPQTVLTDHTQPRTFKELTYDTNRVEEYLKQVLQLEAVACKDWLTNKVDRSVTGKVALQQTAGPLQLPLNNLGIAALDYQGKKGVATAIGHAPAPGLIDPAAGSRLAVAEALTNLVWAPLEDGLKGVSLSANWMWPAKTPGEDARLYRAVAALSEMACVLGINVPTGKDSLSMKQQYPDNETVYAPGTVIVSSCGEVSDIRQAVTPVLASDEDSILLHLDLSSCPLTLGGSSFSQTLNQLGTTPPDVVDFEYFIQVFGVLQELISRGLVLAGHDVSSGGLITTLLEMSFSTLDRGLSVDLTDLGEDPVKVLFHENPGVVLQVTKPEAVIQLLGDRHVRYSRLGTVTNTAEVKVSIGQDRWSWRVDELRRLWYQTSSSLDRHQCAGNLAAQRFENFDRQPLQFVFPRSFEGTLRSMKLEPRGDSPAPYKAAIIREKGVNGDREMAYSLYLAGFEVKDVHMTDLIAGRETLEDIHFVVFVGGFSNSDVLGSAKGWAGAFMYNPKAHQALKRFYQRSDTLSLGVCNGCQLMMELGVLYPDVPVHPKMTHNDSGKFESTFVTVDIPRSNSIMLKSLEGTQLGIWVAHGEGKFVLPSNSAQYQIAAHYHYGKYPGNPNGSPHQTAALVSQDGRHLAIMPHLERSIFPWQWGYYPPANSNHQITPWLEAFVNARNWVARHLDIKPVSL